MDPHTREWCVTNEKALASGHHGGFKCIEYEELKQIAESRNAKIAEVVREELHGRTSCSSCGGKTAFRSYSAGFATYCNDCRHVGSALTKKSRRLFKLREANPKFTVISSHGINEMPIEMRCKACDHMFSAWMKNGRDEARCPKCNPSTKSSHEYEVVSFLEELGIEDVVHTFRLDDTKNKTGYMTIDVYVPSKRVGVEINGLYWHSDDRTRHMKKKEAAAATGARLLQFTDEQRKNRRRVCESMIRSAVGKNSRVWARRCEMVSLSAAEYREFCDENHMDGYAPAAIKIGLRDGGGKLVQVASFSKNRFGGFGEWELVRSCSLQGLTVVGGLSRLLRNRPAGSLVSYSCSDWYDGSSYGIVGMREDGATPPSYVWHKGGRILSRYQTFKSKLPRLLGSSFDSTLSEAENMERAGWRRYYGCGSKRWVLDK